MRGLLLLLAIACVSIETDAAALSGGRMLEHRSAVVDAGIASTHDTTGPIEQALQLPAAAALVYQGELHSLSGTHSLFQLELDGRSVVGAGATLTTTETGATTVEARLPLFAESVAPLASRSADPLLAIANPDQRPLEIIARERVWYPGENGLIDADSWTISDGTFTWSVVTRRADGFTLEVDPHFYNSGAARVFLSNPVQRLADPTLRDSDDSAAAVPPAAYSIVPLQGLKPGAGLNGEHVTIVELSSPADSVPLPGDDLTRIDRSDPRFEAANAYVHIDASQRHLQSLGYYGHRRIINRSIHVDPRALGGADSSFFILRPGGGYLAFGIGGTDDAEDSDIVLHEYGHAIQDAIAPGSFGGPVASEARALGEGFSDYWAFSSGWLDSISSGSDPFCLAEWDARCHGSTGCAYPPDAQCLRRVDSARTMAEFRRVNGTGVEHQNGEIWSHALSRIFLALVERRGHDEGRRIADVLALEGHFGVPPSPTFGTVARRMIQADSVLFGGAHRSILCSAFTRSLILTSSCNSGAPDVFYPGHGAAAIPDADPVGMRLTRTVSDVRLIERVFVSIDIEHPQRGDLKLFLIAPDGTPIKLHDTSFADTASGIRVTYGLDAEPAESLDILRGRPAAGLWTLHVIDTRSRDSGIVRSWGIGFLFDGLNPAKRSGDLVSLFPVVISGTGAQGEWFSSDIILAAAESGATAELWFNRSSSGAGTEQRLEISLEPRQTLRVRDALRLLLGQGGSGSLEVRAISGKLRATSATGSSGPSGPVSQAVRGIESGGVAAPDSGAIFIPVPTAAPIDRVNVGISEVGGEDATARVRYRFAGEIVAEDFVQLLPRELVQTRLGVESDLIEISIAGGRGAVAAYVSTIHAESGDPALLHAAAASNAELLVPVISARGASASQWHSDFTFGNPSARPLGVTLTLRHGDGSVRGQRSLLVSPHRSLSVADLVATNFAAPDFIGTLSILPAGDLVIGASIRGSEGRHLVRQFIEPSRTTSSASAWLLLPTGADDGERTNVFIASSEDRDVITDLTHRAASGDVLARMQLTVPSRGLIVVPLGMTRGTGRVELETEGNARLASWISVVNNQSGDADTWSSLPPLP